MFMPYRLHHLLGFAHLAVLSFEMLLMKLSLTGILTEANFTCPPDNQTSIFACRGEKFTCSEQSDTGFFLDRILLSLFPVPTGGTKHVRLTVYVDKESARAMNSGDEKLEDILVLHLEGGKDFFVSLEFTNL